MPRSKASTPEKAERSRPLNARGFVHGRSVASELRVGLYARVSHVTQQSIPMQLREMREYAARRGWRVVLEVKEARSSYKRRPEREALLAAARRREVDVVIAWKLDRFGRSTSELVVTLHELHALGVAFVSLTEGFDLTTPNGRAMAGMLAVFAEFERELRRERVMAGIAQARREGRHLGRPKSAALKAPIVRRLHAREESQAEIARRLGISRTSVRRILRGDGLLGG